MEPLIGQGVAATAADADIIKDGDIRTFMDDVIEASRRVPVIVDFWAPWCGPCKQLGPALEKVVRAAGGKVRLVKIDIDQNPEIAQQMRVQSIPTVYAFVNGQPVDGFNGALPESQVRAFVQRLLQNAGGGDPVSDLLDAAAEAMEAGDAEGAAQAYAEILRADPSHPEAFGGLVRVQVHLGRLDQADATLAAAPAEIANHPAMASARSALALARQAADAGDAGALAARVEQDPDDHQARFDLSAALLARGDRQGAVDALLEIVRRDRSWNEDGARLQLLKLFEAFGFTDPVTVAGRRRLSTLLFS